MDRPRGGRKRAGRAGAVSRRPLPQSELALPRNTLEVSRPTASGPDDRPPFGGMPGLLLLLFVFAAAKGVEITRLSMPRWVQNGTEDSVVLDCEYDYSAADDKRLVVKWFLNDDPLPIYQWIPELNLRSASPRLQGRLNMDYAVSPSSQHTRYRALNILRPTTDLSGRYSCQVVSLLSQDAEEQVMVVYAPPRSFEFNWTRSGDVVNLTCEADGVYPMPKIAIFQTGADEPALVSGVRTVTAQRLDAYHIQVSRQLRDRDLRGLDVTPFECVLSIPGTDYESQRKVFYYPGVSDNRSSREWSSVLLTLCAVSLLFLS